MIYMRPDQMVPLAQYVLQVQSGCILHDVFTVINPKEFYVEDWRVHGGPDYWKDPMQTWTTRRGDCEDLSFLVGSVLVALGYRYTRILMGYHKNLCHVWAETMGPRGHWWLLEATTGKIIPMRHSEDRPHEYQVTECLYSIPGNEPLGTYYQESPCQVHGCLPAGIANPLAFIAMIQMLI